MTPTEALERLHRLAHRQWSMQAAEAGLSHSEFEYLRAIRAQERQKVDENDHGQHLQDVVEAMGVRKASASAMVLKLEERGLVHRVPCQMDARAQHILITDEGAHLLRQGEEVYRGALRHLYEGLEPYEAAAFRLALKTLADLP
ncbi:MarR family winged helix-turn-helix transcriptional regulator [Stappia sp. 28M-7]|jgi:DNA-binding MarR family transcriptional regulator|uniref:MarR family winged helix-turn-helix transcriptional regulator n=1 Tax=Stappia sp. 28M-7 TaxID=2762596 RepID=UPI000E7607A9|nr:MarR family transcriptional regulator [Stappia sp. 28M-7]MBC2858373.1 winged helix DNA-binding protein [Stappia sp. 28M-7]